MRTTIELTLSLSGNPISATARGQLIGKLAELDGTMVGYRPVQVEIAKEQSSVLWEMFRRSPAEQWCRVWLKQAQVLPGKPLGTNPVLLHFRFQRQKASITVHSYIPNGGALPLQQNLQLGTAALIDRTVDEWCASRDLPRELFVSRALRLADEELLCLAAAGLNEPSPVVSPPGGKEQRI